MHEIYDFMPVLPETRFPPSPCGYFKNRQSWDKLIYSSWLENFSQTLNYYFTDKTPFTEIQLFDVLKQKGYCRYNNVFYLPKCKGCKECTPIRLKVSDFSPSKSQRKVLRINEDLTIKLEKNPANFITDEKIFMFREYDYYHNHDTKPKLTFYEASERLKDMCTGYKGTWNMEYYLNNKLVAVAILDHTTDYNNNNSGLSSNYFYYDVSPEILKRSIGVFSVLKELELCKESGFEYYYLGLYLKDCRKMNYKTNYKPYELLQNGRWIKYDKNDNKIRSKNPRKINSQEIIPFPYPDDSIFEGFVDITKTIPLQLLYSAYMQGVFPWFNEDNGDPVIWQSPKDRFVIFPEDLHVPKSVEKFIKKSPYTYTKDKCFKTVMENCGAMERRGQFGTWIGPKMIKAYTEFHKLGYAHSYEVWNNEKLVGGFYGVQIGNVFFGESMFTIESNSAKSAFCIFAKEFFKNGGVLIDCQAYTENMERFGAKEIKREEFWSLIKQNLH